MPLWNTFSFVVWYLIPLTALVFIYSRISHLLWTSDSRQSSRQSNGVFWMSSNQFIQLLHTESTVLTSSGTTAGSSWQLKNGRIVVYKQESLLNVPTRDNKIIEKKKAKETEGRRKVVRLLVAVVVSFAVLTFPHHARLLYTVSRLNPQYQLWSRLDYLFTVLSEILYTRPLPPFKHCIAEMSTLTNEIWKWMIRSDD